MSVVVNFSEQALIQILAAGLEAYAVPHQAELAHWSGIETYLTLWGNMSDTPNSIICQVEFALTSTAAERAYSSVTPNQQSITLKSDLISAFFPQYQLLGDLHSHPWLRGRSKAVTPAEIRKQKLYGLSEADVAMATAHLTEHSMLGYYLAAVLTISTMQRVSSSMDGYQSDNVIEFSMNNYKCWLSCEVMSKTENDSGVDYNLLQDVIIRAPALLNLHQFQKFGKATGSNKLTHSKE